ncbi:MAG TPA: ribonuclease P protein component [Candidatus Gracilibacteria bacterium]
MIPKQNKFHRNYFEAARRRMRSFRYAPFLFLFKKAQNQSHFAVVISKKAMKQAVDRNRFKRQVYSLLETHFLKEGIPIEVICLYKGTQIAENGQDLEKAIKAFKAFYHSKK